MKTTWVTEEIFDTISLNAEKKGGDTETISQIKLKWRTGSAVNTSPLDVLEIGIMLSNNKKICNGGKFSATEKELK